MKNNILSARQYGLIVAILSFVFKFSLLPGLMSEIAGRDVWLVITATSIMEAITLIIIVRVSYLGGLEAVKERYGIAVYLIIVLPIAIVAIMKIAVYMSEVNNFTTSYLFYNISEQKLSVILAVAVIYLGVRAAKGIGRVAEVSIWFIPVVAMIGIIFGKIHLEPSFVLPIGAEGAKPLLDSFDRYLFWFFDYTPLLFFRIRKEEDPLSRNHPEKHKRKQSVFAIKVRPMFPVVIGGVIALVIVPLMYAVFVMTYGMSGRLVSNAFSSLGSFNVVNTEIGSIDWPAIVMWLSYSVIVLSVMAFAAGKAIENRRIPHRITVGIAVVIALILTLVIFYNSELAIDFATGPVRYVVTAVNVIMPCLALMLLEIKDGKESIVQKSEISTKGGAKNEACL